MWHKLLDACPWITVADENVLAMYCDSWSHYQQARLLSIQTPVVSTKKGAEAKDGKLSKNPAWTARNEAFKQLQSAGSELGLTPSGRSALMVPSGKTDKVSKKFFG